MYLELAAEHGHDFTAEEGFEALESIRQEHVSGELSDEELEGVAGGKNTTGTIMESVSGMGVACAVQSAYDAGKDQTGQAPT